MVSLRGVISTTLSLLWEALATALCDARGGAGPVAVHDHVLVRHEHFLEHDQRLLPGELGIAGIHLPAVDDPGVVGLAADDVDEARRIDPHGADHRPVALRFGPAHGGNADKPMQIDRAG